MRHLFIAMATAWWALGCAAGIPPALLQARTQEAERWQRQYEEERVRSEELAERLSAVESELERVANEHAEANQALQVLSEEVARLAAERDSLEEHNAQLQARQRELARLQEQLSDKWFESALSRARRHSPPPAPAATSPGGGQGASP